VSYAKAEMEFFDPTRQIDWRPVEGYPDGIFERVLSEDPASGDYTRLLYFQPGVETHDRLIHDFWEEVFIAEGYLIDKTLGQTFTAGMYACRPPGMEHGPYSTPEGCVTFEVRYRR
jgi:ChrR-like protein with cupin domain